jgi:hypothetical protein
MRVNLAAATLRFLCCVFIFAWVSAWLWGCAALDERSQEELDAAYGPNEPMLEATYAAEVIQPADIWRIYLKGSDPDGDMQYIQVWLEVPSRTTTPVRLTVDPDQGEGVSGYLILNTLEFGWNPSDLIGGWVRLRIVLEDRAGHQSEAAEFFLKFQYGVSMPPPPPDVFQERFLGKIPAVFGPVVPAAPGRLRRW